MEDVNAFCVIRISRCEEEDSFFNSAFWYEFYNVEDKEMM